MKVIRVFIFCLCVFGFLLPVSLEAAQKSIVVELEIIDEPGERIFNPDLLREILNRMRLGELNVQPDEPVVVNELNIAGLDLVLTISGSLESILIVSIF